MWSRITAVLSDFFKKHFTPENFQFYSTSLPEHGPSSLSRGHCAGGEGHERCWWNRLAACGVDLASSYIRQPWDRFMQIYANAGCHWWAEEMWIILILSCRHRKKAKGMSFGSTALWWPESVPFPNQYLQGQVCVSSCLLGLWGPTDPTKLVSP